MTDISFSGADLAVVAALLATVTGGLTFMFRLLVAELQHRAARAEEQVDRMIPRQVALVESHQRQTELIDKILELLEEWRP